jgi:hypothetical protein
MRNFQLGVAGLGGAPPASALGAQKGDGGYEGQQRHQHRPHEGMAEGGGQRSADLRALPRQQWGEQPFGAAAPGRQGGRALVLEYH